MKALDAIKAALEAGPTDGPWQADRWTAEEGGCYGWAFSAGGFRLPLSDFETDDPRECDANAAFIAACNPSAIRELLAYVESLEKDAGRYRWLREFKSIDPFGRLPSVPWVVRLEMQHLPTTVPVSGTDLDAAIDAAMEQTK